MPRLSVTITAKLQAALVAVATRDGFTSLDDWLFEKLVSLGVHNEMTEEMNQLEEAERGRTRSVMNAKVEEVRARFK